MRLTTFEVTGPVETARRVGVLDDDTVVDVTAAYAEVLERRGTPRPRRQAEAAAPPEMIEFLATGERAMEAAREVRDAVAEGTIGDGPVYPLADVRVLAPLPRPNTIRAFSVFEEHLRKSLPDGIADVWYEMPIFWKGNPGSVVGPGERVQWPDYTDELDFELEIAAVIGREGIDVDAADAEDYIAGYTLHNDWSARDMQMREMTMGLGPSKGKDFANGFGPYLVPADDVDVTGVDYEIRVDGEVWTDRTLDEYQYSFAEMIEHVSMNERIYPGDVVVSGTVPSGCGLEDDRWIDPGSTVTLTVAGLGTLENTVGTPDA